jgi:hypothetical protein
MTEKNGNSSSYEPVFLLWASSSTVWKPLILMVLQFFPHKKNKKLEIFCNIEEEIVSTVELLAHDRNSGP